MEIDITSLEHSKDNFRYLIDRQRKIEYIKEFLDGSVETFFDISDIDKANKQLIIFELYIETILFYANSLFDILIDIINVETDSHIIKKRLYETKYQEKVAENNEWGHLVVDFVKCYEFNYIRNATNLIKHEKLLGVQLTIGSVERGVFLKPFKTKDFTAENRTSHTTLYEYYYVLIRKSIGIIQEIINDMKLSKSKI